MLAYGLILLKTALSLLEGIFLKSYNQRPHEDSGFIFMSIISFCAMLFFLLTDPNGVQITLPVLAYGIIGGILYSSASFMTFVAFGCGSFAMTNLILSYGLVFSIGYGLIFLKESLSVFAYIGLAMIFVSLFLVRGSSSEKSGTVKTSWKWLLCVGFSFLTSGMYSVVTRMQQIRLENQYTNEFMVVCLGFSGLALFTVGLIRDHSRLKSVFRPDCLFAVGAGISNAVCNLLGLIVYLLIPLSICSPLSAGVKILMSFLVSRFLFKEHFLPRQIAGVAIGTAALILLNI